MLPKLSLIMPTHYSEPKHYTSICSLINVAKQYQESVEVIISDNSGDKEKKDFIKKISFGMQNVKLFDAPQEKNFLYAIQQATGEFCFFVGDDDIILPHSIKKILFELDNLGDAIGLTTSIGIAKNDSYEFFLYDKVDSDQVSTRLEGFLESLSKGNLLFYSIVKNEILKEAIELWVSIPNFQAYHDHLVSLFIIIKGRLKRVDACFFIYDMSNWYFLGDRIKSEIRYIRKAGLPDSILVLQRIMLAIEGVKFILKSCNGQKEEKNKMVVAWFSKWFSAWKYSLYSEGYKEVEEVKACPLNELTNEFLNKHLGRKDLSFPDMFNDLCTLYEKYNETGNKYRDFWS